MGRFPRVFLPTFSNQVEILEFFFFFFFFFFGRLVLYRESVNVKDHKLSDIGLTVALVEPVKVCFKISYLYNQ